MVTLDEGGRGLRGGLELVRVGPPLESRATLAWHMRPPAGERDRPWRIVPDVHPHVILSRYPSGRMRAALVGPRSRHVDVDQGARSFTVGIRLRPGVLPALTGAGARELLDRSVRLDELDGRRSRADVRALSDATNPAEALTLLTHWLLRRVGEPDPVDWRVRGFVHHVRLRPGARVRDIAADLGVSLRGLRVVLAREVGLSPKTAQRITRLHHGLTDALGGTRGGAAAAAHRAGYVDHAHFIRECRALLGETPGAFRRRGLGRSAPEDGVEAFDPAAPGP